MMRGRLQTLVVDSQALRDNPLGDPSLREVPVYEPPEGGAGTPLIAVLAGYGGTGAGALLGTPWDPGFVERYERLLAEGRARPATFVFPDMFTRYGGSQYVNSPSVGRYEDHLVDEVLPLVEQHTGAGGRAARRGLMGKSSGGFGAFHVAFARPERFAALASHSGDAAFDLCYRPDFPRLLEMLDRFGDLLAFRDAFEASPRKSTPQFLAMSMIAMAAAYSPDPEQPLGVALPFDAYTGRLREDVWRRWLDHDPVELAARRGAVLKDYALLFVDAGRRDEYHLQYGARQLVPALRAAGCAVHHDEFDDGHRGVSYRYETSLPLMTEALSR